MPLRHRQPPAFAAFGLGFSAEVLLSQWT